MWRRHYLIYVGYYLLSTVADSGRKWPNSGVSSPLFTQLSVRDELCGFFVRSFGGQFLFISILFYSYNFANNIICLIIMEI